MTDILADYPAYAPSDEAPNTGITATGISAVNQQDRRLHPNTKHSCSRRTVAHRSNSHEMKLVCNSTLAMISL